MALCCALVFVGTVGRAVAAPPPIAVQATDVVRGPAESPSRLLQFRATPADLTNVPAVRFELRSPTGTPLLDGDLGGGDSGEVVEGWLPLPVGDVAGPTSVELHWFTEQEHGVVPVAFDAVDLGWTVHFNPGFHYDPVWWNTQAHYTETGKHLARHLGPGLELVSEYLRMCEEDPDYVIALHQLPYLKTFLEAHPERRAELLQRIGEERCSLVGGTYNELSSTLVSAESTIRNAIYGTLFQQDVLGGDARVFWQCDVFGHDPSFASIMSLTGHDAGAFARGPFHQWGAPRDQVNMPSEFLWMSPDGRSVLTHYMTGHYFYAYPPLAAGSNLASPDSTEWVRTVAAMFEDLKRPALTHHVLLPMHVDIVRPLENLGDVVRYWNRNFVNPRATISTPRAFFDAVQSEIDARGLHVPVITRDMNPIYTGCPVSFADLKTVNRTCENLLREAEILATLAILEGAPAFPWRSIDRAWRQLQFNAHHDGVTGSMSDQVYIDLMIGYRDALELAQDVRTRALEYLAGTLPPPAHSEGNSGNNSGNNSGSVLLARENLWRVWNPVAHARTDHRLDRALPGLSMALVADPAIPTPLPESRSELFLDNEYLSVTLDLQRGGSLASVIDARTGRQLLRGPGNDIVMLEEYESLPGHGEGPWHLSPTGRRSDGLGVPAVALPPDPARPYRITVEATYPLFTKRVSYELTPGSRSLDIRTEIRDWRGTNQLLRAEFPFDAPGARPVFQTAAAIIGRPFARTVDTARDPWTLDQTFWQWVGLGAVLHLDVVDGVTPIHRRAVGVAEIVVADPSLSPSADRLAGALVRHGVTSTSTQLGDRRYGDLSLDSNRPDLRILILREDDLRAMRGPEGRSRLDLRSLYADEDALRRAMTRVERAEAGSNDLTSTPYFLQNRETARDLSESTGESSIPGTTPEVSPALDPVDPVDPAVDPTADLAVDPDTDALEHLPVLVLTARALEVVLDQLKHFPRITVPQLGADLTEPTLYEDAGVALITRGPVSAHTSPDGTLSLNLLRSSTSWPAGVWIDPPERRPPDGAPFEAMHGTHAFEYSLVSHRGDYRLARLSALGQEINHPLDISRIAEPDPQRSAESAFPKDAPVLQERGAVVSERTWLTLDEPAVLLLALKPTGFPDARWKSRPDFRQARTVTIAARLWNGSGRIVTTALTMPDLRLARAWATDLLEQPGEELRIDRETLQLEFGPHQIRTVLLEVERPSFQPPSAARAAPDLESPWIDEPRPSAYWLENRGEGVSDNGVVALAPAAREIRVSPDPSGETVVALRLVNNHRDESMRFDLRVHAPREMAVEMPVTSVLVAPSTFEDLAIRLRRRDLSGPITQPPAALQIEARTPAGTLLAPVWLLSGDPSDPSWLARNDGPSPPDIAVETTTLDTMVGPGQSARVRVTNRTRSELTGEATWIVPPLLWASTPGWRQTVHLRGGESKLFELPLPDRLDSFAMLRFAAAGRVAYSEPVMLVDDPQRVVLGFGVDRARVPSDQPIEIPLTALSRQALRPETALDIEAPRGWKIHEQERVWTTRETEARLDVRYLVQPRDGAVDGTLTIHGPSHSVASVPLSRVPVQRALAKGARTTIDGDLSEWAAPEFTTAESELGSMRAAVRYGPEGLAFAIEVYDDAFSQTYVGASIWEGDSVQLGISVAPSNAVGYDATDLEFGIAKTRHGDSVWCWYDGTRGNTGEVRDARAAVHTEPGRTVYELLLPPNALPGITLVPGLTLGFSYIANDNDGAGFRGAVQWTPGMSGGKDSSLFGDLILMAN